MSNNERTKLIAFTAIGVLCALLIAIITNHSAFPEFFFHSIVMVVIGVIVVLAVGAFLWQSSTRYINTKMWTRKHNRLAQRYFDDWRDHVRSFISLGEFKNPTHGITGILESLVRKSPPKPIVSLIRARITNFGTILRNPLQNFEKAVDEWHWRKKELNYEFLSSLVREFESYVDIHKALYVDFVVTMSGEIKNLVPKGAKRSYAHYKDNYNQFILAYVEFAKECARDELRIFNTNLEKAYEFEE